MHHMLRTWNINKGYDAVTCYGFTRNKRGKKTWHYKYLHRLQLLLKLLQQLQQHISLKIVVDNIDNINKEDIKQISHVITEAT